MLIHHNPLDYVGEVTHQTCEFHKRQPWATFAGCTCSSSYSQRLATTEERLKNIEAKNAEDERRRKHIEDYDAALPPAQEPK